MLKLRRCKQLTLFVQILQYFRVRILDKLARIGSFCCQITLAVHELYKRQVIVSANPGVILTKGRSDVYDTGTIRHGNVGVTGYKMCLFLLLYSSFSGTGIQRLILSVFQFLSLIGFQYLIGGLSFLCQRTEHSIQKRLCQIINSAVSRLYLAVGFLRVDTERHVGGQCPGGCRPCQEISILSYAAETYNRRTLLYRLVALCYFMAGKRGSAAGTVGNNLKALV